MRMTSHGGLRPVALYPRSENGDAEQRALAADKPFGFDDFIAVLRKRFWVLLLTTLAALVIAILSLSTYTPQYVASAQMLLGVSEVERSSSDLLETRALNDSAIQGELAILSSGALLMRVVRRLELDKEPEFNAALRPPAEPIPVIDPMKDALRAVMNFGKELLFPPKDDTANAAEPSANIAEAALAQNAMMGDYGEMVNTLRGKMSVRQRGSSYVVEVTVISEDPARAAAIANTIVDEYIDFVSDKRFEAAQRFTTWLETRVGELAQSLEESETAVISFEAVADSEVDSPERLDQQMQEMTTRLVETRARLAETQALATQARTLLETEGALPAAGLLTSPTLNDYTARLATLRRDEAIAKERFADGSAQIEAIRREMDVVKTELHTEVERAVLQLVNQASVLQVNLQALRHSLGELENTVLDRSKEQIKLNQLERIADANRRIYEDFLGRFKESSEIQNLRRSDAEVVSYGSPPYSPALPRKKVTVVLAIAAGLAVGLGIAFLLELLPKRFMTSDQVTRQTGLRVFGHLPGLPRQSSARALAARLRASPAGPLARSALTTARNLELSLGRPLKSVIVVSPGENQDRATMSMLLSWAAARQDKSCLLLDADVKTSELTRRFDIAPRAGFVEVLYGDATLDEAIVFDPHLGVSVLPMVPAMIDPATLFGTERADKLFKELGERFDVVVLDAPPLQEVSDVVSVPTAIDIGLMVFSSGRTPLGLTAAKLPLFESMQMLVEGAVLTRLRARS